LIGVLAKRNIVDLAVGLDFGIIRLDGLIGIVFGLLIVGWGEAVLDPMSVCPEREVHL
jgi:hypothetical protein